MNAEFNVWLLIVGLVIGAGLVWLVVMDSRRRESDIDATERPREAAWLSAVMIEDGYDVSPEAADRLLLLHRAYLEAPPPDGVNGDGAPLADPQPEPAVGQIPPSSTGGLSSDGSEASTSETPNVASSDTPETADDAPVQ